MRFLRWFGAATLILTLGVSEAAAAAKHSGAPVPRKSVRKAANTIDNATRMDVNNLDMFVTNHGSYAWDLTTGNSGLIYPKGGTKTAVFAAGPWIGAKVGGVTRVAIGEYSQEFTPGPMVGGTFQADNPRFKSYKIERGNTTSFDYLNWPVQDGAPVDSLGQPALLGDAMIWSVYNDADPGTHTNNSGFTAPLGVEIQQTTFAFNRGGALGNIIFIRYKLLNKGGNTLDSMYFSAWSDPDLGDASDDLDGCDTTLSVGFIYNATNADGLYGSTPPSVGWDFFRGPIVPNSIDPTVNDTLGMTSFNKYINGTDPHSAGETYNYMRGLHADGTPVHVFDDTTLAITKFQVSGLDPGAASSPTNWLDSNPSDRRLMLSTGPFTMSPGDTQEVTIAVIVGQGTDRISSISDMKNKDAAAQVVFDLNFDIPSPPPNPTVYVQPLDKAIRLIWGQEPVGYNSANASLGQDFHFEGFRVWQLPSGGGFQGAKVVATFDESDGVGLIYSDLFNSQKAAFERTLVVDGKDEGLRFQYDITSDAFRGGPLVNNKSYYFAVTAYSYDVLNTAPYLLGVNEIGTISEVLESGFRVQTGTPRGSSAVFSINAEQIAGDPVGTTVVAEQLIQNAIGDSLYQVSFAPDDSWMLVNVTSGDTLLANQTNTSGAYDYPIVNGIMTRVVPATQPASIYQLLGGTGLQGATDSLNLAGAEQTDSTGTWVLSNKVDNSDITWFNFADGVGHDYVVQVLTTASQHCWEYSFGDPSLQQSYDVPFRVWDLGSCSYGDPSDDVEVSIEARDDDGSGDWSWGDRVYIRRIPYASVAWGTAGIITTDYDPTDEPPTIGRLALTLSDPTNPVTLPPAEARIRIRGGKPCAIDKYQFRTVPAGSAPGQIVGNDIKKILAVPNPYYAHSQYELTQFDRVMKFTNIPASRKVTIRIFNLGGDLVRTIRREATTADAASNAEIIWDLNTDNRLPVGSGVYIYRVDVEGVGSKTDRIAVFIEKERLDNF